MDEKEYKKHLRQFHKESDRHVLTVEIHMGSADVHRVVALSDRIRKAGNELVGLMRKNYDQMMRTKKYRKLLRLYGAAKTEEEQKVYADQLEDMQKQYRVTWDFCRKSMIHIDKKYNVASIFALTKAEDVWKGIKKCLYGNGRTIRFSKHGNLPCIRAKQINRGIPLSVKNDILRIKIGKSVFEVRPEDRFQREELNAILAYLSDPETADRKAVQTFLDEECCIDTFRPCYAVLVPRRIRGKYRIYLHLAIEGKAKPKYDRAGNPRHSFGKGVIGADVGTQTVAYTSRKEVGLKNLSERGRSIQKSERMERVYLRAMDRSRRATNPQNYNEDGTIRKGRKTWTYSKHYRKLKARHAELCRVNAVNRQLAIREDANHLRSLGDVFITEPKNASKLMKRAKETTRNAKGKCSRKKRFGKSIRNRCPSEFQTAVQQRFETTGGTYIEVPNRYRASQYDHTANEYIKKKLSDRIYKLKDGTLVQRDWYSSFLLYCYDFETEDIDRNKCVSEFKDLYEKEQRLIEQIKASRTKVMNSGIRLT